MEDKHTTTQDLERAVATIITHFDDLNREGLQNTPKRVARMFCEILTAKEPKITVFASQGYDQMISDKGIKYYTLCEHHLMPFFGEVKIAYIPDKHIIGLSKLARIVEYFSKRLNTQEYFTNNIANYLEDKLKPRGLGVLVTGRHLCKEMRGIKKEGVMTTIALRGLFLEQKVKEEFLNI